MTTGGPHSLGHHFYPDLLAAPLIPWAALCCLGFLGTAALDGQTTDSGLRFGAAMAPAMGVFVCALVGVLWLALLLTDGRSGAGGWRS